MYLGAKSDKGIPRGATPQLCRSRGHSEVYTSHSPSTMNSNDKPRVITLPGQRLRNLAMVLLQQHPIHSSSTHRTPKYDYSIQIVTISDTHNTQPNLPAGDVLIHAGDLSENGSFDEIQKQLTWLSSQPHQYKICIAGNHDVLLDEEFLEKYPERRYDDPRTLKDLNWGSVHYLNRSSITLEFPSHSTPQSEVRKLRIYGSPWTPQYVPSAFQYPRSEDIWEDCIPSGTDIVVTHGPPRLHLDTRDFYRAGCPYLAQEVARVCPSMVVFGHIHAAYGREDVVLDGVRRSYEEIVGDWAGSGALLWMGVRVLGARVRCWVVGREKMVRSQMVTTFVNAAVVGGSKNELRNEPIVVEL